MKRFLLLSDLHTTDVNPSSSTAPSYLSTYSAVASGQIDPLTDLETMLVRQEFVIDYILCPGDIANKSTPGPLRSTWERLNRLAEKMGSKLVATIGNHDVDSRYKENNFDPRGYIMALQPSIPSPQRQNYLEYWAEHFTTIADDECNLIILNTAAYHGGGAESQAELEHGQISPLTISLLRTSIERMPQKPINMVLCHHQLIRPDKGDAELLGHTRGGDQLIDLLNEHAGTWIIVHGHKHIPELYYAYGGSNAPLIVGCASFSAQVNTNAQNNSPNQFHYLICDPDAAARASLPIAGCLRSWTWLPGKGWTSPHGSQGLPALAGFGFRGNVRQLARSIDAELASREMAVVSWSAAVQIVPQLERLIPNDFHLLERELGNLGIIILCERDGSISQVGRRT